MSRNFEQIASQLEGILGYRPGEEYLRPLIRQLEEYDRLMEANGSAPGRLTSTRTDTQAIFELIQKLYELAQAEKPADGSKAFLEQVAIARGKYVTDQRRSKARKRAAGRIAAGIAGASVMAALANAAGATPDLENLPEPVRHVLEMLAVVDDQREVVPGAVPSLQDSATQPEQAAPANASDAPAEQETGNRHLVSDSPLIFRWEGAANVSSSSLDEGLPVPAAGESSAPGAPSALPQVVSVPEVVKGTAAKSPPEANDIEVVPGAPEEYNARSGETQGIDDGVADPTGAENAPDYPVVSGPPEGTGPNSGSAPGRWGEAGAPLPVPGVGKPDSPGQSGDAPGQQNSGPGQPSTTPGNQNNSGQPASTPGSQNESPTPSAGANAQGGSGQAGGPRTTCLRFEWTYGSTDVSSGY